MTDIDISGPWFEDFHHGLEFDAPAVTLTEGLAALHQATFGDRLRLPLDHHASRRITGREAPLAHPLLPINVAIGQSTWASQRVKANLFYRGLSLLRPVHLGDTLYTRTRVVGLRQNKLQAGRAATGIVALEMTTTGEAPRLLLSAVEHPASRAAAAAMQRRGWLVQEVPVDRLGAVDLEALEPLLAPPTRLVSLIWGQSEVGTVQPVQRIAALCRSAGVVLHLDAVQVLGHQPMRIAELPVDLLSLAAHKIQGPRGIGALVVKEGVDLQPCIGGGGQEGGLRSGTEAVALVAGFEAALRLAMDWRVGGTVPAAPGATPM